MKNFSLADGTVAPAGFGSRMVRSRSSSEELARVLGGIGAPPDSLPLLAERAEALRNTGQGERLP